MDEPSFIVTKIYPDGLLGFFDHGGPDENCVANENVYVGPSNIPGLIIKQDPASINHAEFRIDIGAVSGEEASEYVCIGDVITFHADPKELDNGWMISKAFDDRAGCFALIELLKNSYDVDLYGILPYRKRLGFGAQDVQNIWNPISILILKPLAPPRSLVFPKTSITRLWERALLCSFRILPLCCMTD